MQKLDLEPQADKTESSLELFINEFYSAVTAQKDIVVNLKPAIDDLSLFGPSSAKLLSEIYDTETLVESSKQLFIKYRAIKRASNLKEITIGKEELFNDFKEFAQYFSTINNLLKSLDSEYTKLKVSTTLKNSIINLHYQILLNYSYSLHKAFAKASFLYYASLKNGSFDVYLPFINFNQSIFLTSTHKQASINLVVRVIREINDAEDNPEARIVKYISELFDLHPALFAKGEITLNDLLQVIDLSILILKSLNTERSSLSINIEELETIGSGLINIRIPYDLYNEILYAYRFTTLFPLMHIGIASNNFYKMQPVNNSELILIINNIVKVSDEIRKLYISLNLNNFDDLYYLTSEFDEQVSKYEQVIKSLYKTSSSSVEVNDLLNSIVQSQSYIQKALNKLINCEAQLIIDTF